MSPESDFKLILRRSRIVPLEQRLKSHLILPSKEDFSAPFLDLLAIASCKFWSFLCLSGLSLFVEQMRTTQSIVV